MIRVINEERYRGQAVCVPHDTCPVSTLQLTEPLVFLSAVYFSVTSYVRSEGETQIKTKKPYTVGN